MHKTMNTGPEKGGLNDENEGGCPFIVDKRAKNGGFLTKVLLDRTWLIRRCIMRALEG